MLFAVDSISLGLARDNEFCLRFASFSHNLLKKIYQTGQIGVGLHTNLQQTGPNDTE